MGGLFEEDMAFTGGGKTAVLHFKMPIANNIDLQSPLGVSVFSNAIPGIEGLDIAWTRLDDETYDSQHITFLGDSLLKNRERPSEKGVLPAVSLTR